MDLQKRILEEGGVFNTRACHNPLDNNEGEKAKQTSPYFMSLKKSKWVKETV